MIQLLIVFCTAVVFAQEADHLLLTRIVTQPDEAESFSIYNPTDASIDLTNYYVSDYKRYYRMQTDSMFLPSNPAADFIAQFPSTSIESGDTIIIVLNENYNDFYGDNFSPDFYLFGNANNSMLETEKGSFGGGIQKISDSSELLILFMWDGDPSNPIKDVDYFIWGSTQSPIEKTDISGYQNDTSAENQLYFEETPAKYYAYSRIGIEETGESESGGNGITGHDETSENFQQSWEVIPLFNLGCTDPEASNYDPIAEVDDESCIYSIQQILNGSFIGTQIITEGIIIDYFDISTVSCSGSGPKLITIGDGNGNELDLKFWDEAWSDELNPLVNCPFARYKIQVLGTVDEFCDTNPDCEDLLTELSCLDDCKCSWDNENNECVKICGSEYNWACTQDARDHQNHQLDQIQSEGNLQSKKSLECSLQLDVSSSQNVKLDSSYKYSIPESFINFGEILTGNYYHKSVKLKGIITDYFDITQFCGPHAITLSDEATGHSLELTIWDDDWSDELECLTQPPFFTKEVLVSGFIGDYEGNTQIQVCGEVEIVDENYEYQAPVVSLNSILDNTHDGKIVACEGLLIDYFDVTIYEGPHALTIEDNQGYRLELTIWPNTWDIPNSTSAYLLQAPYNRYYLNATGQVTEYEGEKQLTISGSNSIAITDTVNTEGVEYTGLLVTFNINTEFDGFDEEDKNQFISDLSDILEINEERILIKDKRRGSVILDINIKDNLGENDTDPSNEELLSIISGITQIGEFEVEIQEIIQLSSIITTIRPQPFIIIPTLGEKLDFLYSFPANSRVIIRIFDLSGRFITSLVDKYYENSATVFRDEYSSAWDGRDHLGQIVSPGTYIMHIEAMNPITGESNTDAAPVVVGVKN